MMEDHTAYCYHNEPAGFCTESVKRKWHLMIVRPLPEPSLFDEF